MSIADNLLNIELKIKSYNAKLIAVSKFQSESKIIEAIEAGQVDFGENYLQEAQSKWNDIIKIDNNIKLHFIGQLQSNKISKIMTLFDFIHTVSKRKHIDYLLKMKKNSIEIKPFFLQVNLAKEVQKAGFFEEDLPNIINLCLLNKLPLEGLMIIPDVKSVAKDSFARMKQLKERYKLKSLSMGMSDDFKDALEMGSDYIRIGTAIFGNR